jgi:two-component system response regulator YesN
MIQVLIVDDMDIVRIELKRLKLWEKNGFIISDEAKNGQEALEKLGKSSFDMVITDIRMPKVDGIELLKSITVKKLCPCVILCSDHSEFTYARQGLVLGAFDYMVKPVVEEELDKLLNRAKEFILDKRQEQQKIMQLEKKLEEKVDVFFPQAEVDQLIGAINAGDARGVEYAANIVDISCTSMERDIIKVKSLLNSIMYQIRNRTMESNKWLGKFIDADKMGAIDFTRANEEASIKSVFVSEVRRMVNLLGRLKCLSHGSIMIEQVCSFVLENVDEEISLSSVAEALFINKSYISGNFKQKTGRAFIEYLTDVKMERAKKLIRDGNIKIYEIGELLGFRDIEYFSKVFKKCTGSSPTEYRLRNQKEV